MEDNDMRNNPGLSGIEGGAQTQGGMGGAPSRDLTTKAKEVASAGLEEAQRLTGSTRERVLREVDDRKGLLSQKLDELAANLDEVGGRAGDELPQKLAERASRSVRDLSQMLSSRSTEELIADAGRKIRERPGMFLASCLALGFIGARLLRK